MPDAFASALGGGTKQNWAVVAQADRWQPPAHNQLVALSDGRLQPLDDERANRSVQAEADAIDARMRRGELVLLEQPASRLAAAQQFPQQVAEFGQTRLSGAFEQLVKIEVHLTHLEF